MTNIQMRGGSILLVGGEISTTDSCCCGETPCYCCYNYFTIYRSSIDTGQDCNNILGPADVDDFFSCGNFATVLYPQQTGETIDNACCMANGTPPGDWMYSCQDTLTVGDDEDNYESFGCIFDPPTQQCVTNNATYCEGCDPAAPYIVEEHTAYYCLRYRFEVRVCYAPITGTVALLVFEEQIWFRAWIKRVRYCSPFDPNNPPDPPEPLPEPPCGYEVTYHEIFNELAQTNVYEWIGLSNILDPCGDIGGFPTLPQNLGAPTNEVLSDEVVYDIGLNYTQCTTPTRSSFLFTIPAACSASYAELSYDSLAATTPCGYRTLNPDIPECPGCVGEG